MEPNGRSRTLNYAAGMLAVGALALGLKLEGAPVSSDVKRTPVVTADTSSADPIPTEAVRIKLGAIPNSLPIMPVVTSNPYNDIPSQMRAVGLLRGPMPLRDRVAGIAAGVCTFDIDCEDGDPCTNDFCDIDPGQAPNTGVCNNEVLVDGAVGDLNGDDCSDGLACNGTETCQGATVFPCEGMCVGGGDDGDSCTRKTDCVPPGVCGQQTCVGGDNDGVSCDDNNECGSIAGSCQAPGAGNDPVVCGGGQVCDENADPAGCVAQCANDGECDDTLTCNGAEVCDVGTGLCSSPGNPCGAEGANCLERACINGGVGVSGTSCETHNDCSPGDPTSCSLAGPHCFAGRCCVGTTRQIPNRTKDLRCASGGDWFELCSTDDDCTAPAGACRGCDTGNWYPGDNGQLSLTANVDCPIYSAGIADEGDYFVTAGPASLSPFPNDLTDLPLRKLGDDYDTGQDEYIQLQYLRFAGGVTTAANGRIAFEFYDENGNFVEDVFFISAAGANQIQVVQVFALVPTLTIPPKGFIVGHVLQAFAGSPTARGEFLWLSTTNPPDVGVNDENTLYTDTDLDGLPSAVANFLAVCNGGDRDGLECDADGDNIPGCPGGTCESVPGVLAFELEGDLTPDAPRGGCCDSAMLDCNELLEWECAGAGGSYLGDGVRCASCDQASLNVGNVCRTCSGGTNDGLPCTGAADCPGGSCTLNDIFCRLCDDLVTPCTSDGDCGGGTCGGGACAYNTGCTTGACCIPASGECQEGLDPAACGALSGVFRGLGTTCDPDWCEQPMPYPGSDDCETTVVSVLEVPAGDVCLQGPNKGDPCNTPGDCGGADCERTIIKTITGNNATASNTFAAPDSCFQPQDYPGAELGWHEAFQIHDPAIRPEDTIGCGNLVIDHCCTDPVKIPAYRILYDACPCGDPIFTKPNPWYPWWTVANPSGAPFCLEDNMWQFFTALRGANDATELAAGVGTYYYPILSFLGGNFEQYQFHVRIEACPDAVCCIGEDCKYVNILECTALGGFFHGPPYTSFVPPSCPNHCLTGSCCTGPGECVDHRDPGDTSEVTDVTKAWCEDTIGGVYLGGVRCMGGICQGGTREGQSCSLDEYCPDGVCVGSDLDLAQPSPCPICEIRGPDNCQLFDDSVTSRSSDIGLPAGGVHVADDFKPLGDTINKVCVWGAYVEPDEWGNAMDCSDAAMDAFRIRVYASDAYGLPDTSSLVGEANPLPEDVIRVRVPNSANELLFDRRVWGYTFDLGDDAITGLDASGNTCYWLEVVNRLDGSCGWSWFTVDMQNNDFSAMGGAGQYGLASPRNRDMAFCLDTNFEPGACGSPIGYCCDCDGACSNETRRDCLHNGRRWRIEDTCATFECLPGPTSNDLCADVVAGGFPDTAAGTVLYDNTCSNADGVNPVNTELGPVTQISSDVWFKYIATCDGEVTISTCPVGPAAGGGLDTIVAAYVDPVDPAQCICPEDADAQDAAVGWVTEPPQIDGPVHAADENCDGVLNGGGGYIQGAVSPGDCVMIRVGGFPGQGSEEGQGTVTIRCRYLEPPCGMSITLLGGGNRYLYLRAGGEPCGGVSLGEQFLRVKFLGLDGYPVPAQDYLYVGAPSAAPEEYIAKPGLTFTAAPLTCGLYARDWSAEGTIAIYGAEIMPGSVYQVQFASSLCSDLTDERCWSPPATITTLKYGDIWPLFDGPGNPPQPDFGDIAAMVAKFQANGPAVAPDKAIAQLQPNNVFPDRPIDFNDIAADVGAFMGTEYSEINFGPCACPSSVTCGATPCANDMACQGNGDGLCVGGFCADKCGRCSP